MIRKILLSVLLIIVLLVSVILFNTFTFTSQQPTVTEVPALAISDTAVRHFQESIRFKTVSYTDSSLFDSSQFLGFHRFLQKSYPLVHSKLKRETVGQYTLVYEWAGKNLTLKPVILMAHQDVVPIEEETAKMWEVEPFSGVVKDGYVWGRGTVDDKINIIAILESAERLLAENYQPERTVYFVFGHDEEISGTKGAKMVAQLFKKRGIKAEFVLDEGGIITKEKVPGLTGKPVALVGTSEKGYLSVELSVEIPGGHSSMPEKETSIDVLTKAIVHLREKPFPAQFSPSTQDFMKTVGPEMPFMQRMAFANQWLFKPLVIGIYEKTGAGNAIIRTTIAPTIIHSGMKDNVVPTVAKAVVNFRILPGTTSENVIKHAKKAIHDERVKIIPLGMVNEASGGTKTDSEGYKKLIKHIRQNVKGAITTPFLMIGATDSRHFSEISETVLKFSPMIDPIGFHGINERLDVKSYKRCINFYYQLIRDLK
jgi:carboxypeptidase PM20D1